MSEQTELKACPLCDSRAEKDRFNVYCSACQLTLNSMRAEEEWNKRPIEDQLRARIAELEQASAWIPCEERLPEEDGRVLVSTNGITDIVSTAYFYAELKTFGVEGGGDVFAWKTLPSPYAP